MPITSFDLFAPSNMTTIFQEGKDKSQGEIDYWLNLWSQNRGDRRSAYEEDPIYG